jgi:CheY-like chemotaxis protein
MGHEQRLALVVEDEWLIAVGLSEMLIDKGFSVLGPASNTAQALGLLEKCAPDCALLDISLGPEKSYEIGEVLRARGIPFAYLTGYVAGDLPAFCEDVPILAKPVCETDLAKLLSRLLNREAPAGSQVEGLRP